MKRALIGYCFLLIPVLAQSSMYWQCTTADATQKEWTAKSDYRKIALNFAFAQCKKESSKPLSCKASNLHCEPFRDGISLQPMWQCTAIDRNALAWRSNPYPTRDDAALAAKAYCRQKSAVPDTCFINLITCTNTNV